MTLLLVKRVVVVKSSMYLMVQHQKISKNNLFLIQDTIKDIKAETSEKKDAEAIYKSVSNALREMQGLSIDKNTTKIEEIYNKLEELIKISSGLLKKAKKFKKV